MLAETDWAALTALLVGLIGALTTLLMTIIPIYFRAKRGQETLSEAVEACANGQDCKHHLQQVTATDPDLKKHLDKVQARTTQKLKKDGGTK